MITTRKKGSVFWKDNFYMPTMDWMNKCEENGQQHCKHVDRISGGKDVYIQRKTTKLLASCGELADYEGGEAAGG